MPDGMTSAVSGDTTPSANPEAEKKDLLDKMTKILNDAGGESNVGMTDIYWSHLARYRFLKSQS